MLIEAYNFYKTFVLNHLRLTFIIIGVVMLLLIFLVICLFFRKSNHWLMRIILRIPDLISEAEEIFGSGRGTEKKNLVLEVISMLCQKYKVKTDIDFSSLIEMILSTPKKKGGLFDVSKENEATKR